MTIILTSICISCTPIGNVNLNKLNRVAPLLKIQKNKEPYHSEVLKNKQLQQFRKSRKIQQFDSDTNKHSENHNSM
ncbi:hypothetical protein [Borreliella turdi]|uniref:hypothetical protein n=1 Tax=Borreliella turdi TaxID=57863 RepID=UPI002E17A8A6